MKKITLYATILLSLLSLISCSKLEVNETNILGTWAEEYSAYPYYASEGGVIYTFKADGNVDIHYYDVFAGDKDVTTTYTIGKDNIFIDFPNVDASFKTFNIVKFAKNDMEWQRVGTTFSQGTIGSDFKHFVKK